MSYNDYTLDEMENAAVNKSKNLKRGIAAGAGILGIGATAAAAVSHYSANYEPESPIEGEDILAGAEAVAYEEAQQEPVTEAPKTQTTHVKHHIVEDKVVGSEPPINLDVEETVVLLDENGEFLTSYDKGNINGMDFVAIDSDNNNRADILAIDENQNGIYEDNEIYQLDNKSYEIGQGRNQTGYVRIGEGEFYKIYDSSEPLGNEHYAYDEHSGEEGIHNDFEDERTGEIYRNDLAQNNLDYNNHGGEQYRAGMENAPELAYNEEPSSDMTFDEQDNLEETYSETVDYGYSEPTDDLASFDSMPESYDDPLLS